MITVRLTEPQTYVLESDDALDREHPDFNFAKYSETLDVKHIPLKPGGVPTEWKIRPLKRREYENVMALRDNECALIWEAVAYALVGVKNFGRPVEIERKRIGGLDRVTEDSLDAVYKPGVFTELGARVLMISRLDP